MKRVPCLLLIAFVVSGCGLFGSSDSKNDSSVSYEAEVTEGWQEGDSLRVRYVTGYEPEENIQEGDIEIVADSQFSTTVESIDISLAGESSFDSTNTDICIRARMLRNDSSYRYRDYRLRVAVRGAGRSNENESEVTTVNGARTACLPKGNE